MNEEQAERLRTPFPKSAISSLPKAGTYLQYVGHAAVTARLGEVDPTWTWEPVAFDADGLPKFDDKGGLWIRLTVCGVTRYGYGEPQGSDYYDRVKGCIGNAIRVAAMRFGVGLDLWSKDEIATTFEPLKPVATEDQVADWTLQIAAAPNFIKLKAIGDEINGHDMPDEAREELRTLWIGRKEEIDNAGE